MTTKDQSEGRIPLALESGLATGIGSLPHFDPGDAVEFVLRHSPRLPFAPTLPARSKREGMIQQAASSVAGIQIDDAGGLTIDHDAIDPEAPLGPEPFSGDAYVGLRAFLTAVADRAGPVKVSITGPVTLGVALHAAGIDADLAFRISGAVVRERAIALIDKVQVRVPQAEIVVFVDEPSLVSVSQPGFPIDRLAAVDLVSSVLAVIELRAISGLHCCGPADWRLILPSGPQIVSLPTGAGIDRAPGAVVDFLDRGGWLAWGAVPTDRPLGPTPERYWRELMFEWDVLVLAGCDPAQLRRQAIMTPACGLAHHGVTQAEQVMGFASTLADRLRDRSAEADLSVGA